MIDIRELLDTHSVLFCWRDRPYRWQWEAEKVLREAADKGLDYTVVRPGALTDIPRPKEVSLVSAPAIEFHHLASTAICTLPTDWPYP